MKRIEDLDILILEDDRIFAEVLSRNLSRVGLDMSKISIFDSIETGNEELIHSCPDVVFLDLNIIGYSGLDTYYAAQPIFPDACFIILSGHNDEQLAIQCMMAGAQDYISKSDASAYALLKSIQYGLIRKEQLLKEQEQKVAEKFSKQQEYLSNLISQVEAELNTMQAQRDNNEKEFEALQQELEDLNNKVAEAAAYIQANPYVRGRKSNAYKQMEELAATLPATIEQKEKQLEMLANEKENLSNILEALNQASETYYSGLIELEETETPFLADETGTLYGNEQEQQIGRAHV
jgi:DNA-binding NarL/FixJ family response regulator